MLTWLHWAAILIGSAQMAFILWYYAPLMAEKYLGNHQDNFISDFLFRDSIYRSVMTCFVALQLGVCAMFVTRLHDLRGKRHWAMCCFHGPLLFFTEILLIVFAWVGWTVLCSEYTSPDSNGMSKVHATGVGVFISCSVAYVVFMLWHVYALFERFSRLALAEFGLLILLLLVSIVLGFHFIVNSIYGNSDAWVTEHLAFVFFVACHVLLYLIDSSRPAISAAAPAALEISSVFDGVRIQLLR